jgi:hypothetical protein
MSWVTIRAPSLSASELRGEDSQREQNDQHGTQRQAIDDVDPVAVLPQPAHEEGDDAETNDKGNNGRNGCVKGRKYSWFVQALEQLVEPAAKYSWEGKQEAVSGGG